MDIKGTKQQLENAPTTIVKEMNELLAFKCLHYSVTESAGSIVVTIVKKSVNSDVTFGIRTLNDTAKAGKEYDAIEEVMTMKKRDGEKQVEITIHDNHDWQPDLDFYIELYDTKTNERLWGDDTKCRVTILDEDFPGKLGFDICDI